MIFSKVAYKWNFTIWLISINNALAFHCEIKLRSARLGTGPMENHEIINYVRKFPKKRLNYKIEGL